MSFLYSSGSDCGTGSVFDYLNRDDTHFNVLRSASVSSPLDSSSKFLFPITVSLHALTVLWPCNSAVVSYYDHRFSFLFPASSISLLFRHFFHPQYLSLMHLCLKSCYLLLTMTPIKFENESRDHLNDQRDQHLVPCFKPRPARTKSLLIISIFLAS